MRFPHFLPLDLALTIISILLLTFQKSLQSSLYEPNFKEWPSKC